MRKMALSLILCVLMCSVVFVQAQQGVHEPGTGIEEPELMEAGQGTGQGLDNNDTQGEGEPMLVSTGTQEQNQGGDTQIHNQVESQVRAGSYTTENGKEVQVQVQEQSNNKIQLKSGEASAHTSMEMTQEQTQEGTKLKVKLSNGKDSEVKVMPDTASETALERLRLKVCSEENSCQIELKEVGSGEQAKAAYEVQARKQAKFLGLFSTKMQVKAQVDAESGEVLQVKKPWWSFLAREVDEADE